jgi:hypothetical protein
MPSSWRRATLAGHGDWPIDLDEVFEFAQARGLWHPPKMQIRVRFRSDMARSLREEYFPDERNHTVRRYHAARYYNRGEDGTVTQQVFWADMLSDDRGSSNLGLDGTCPRGF